MSGEVEKELTDKKDNPPVLVILGPTGVGKTGASILVAQHLDSEIISADSMQIYRHMDIGTAKPSDRQLNTVKHHMINKIDPSEEFSSGKYIEQVVPVIERLHERGKIPVIVGGTGLYIKAMTRGLFDAPGADWGLREELLAIEKDEPGCLYEKLETLDPKRAGEIVPTDIRRIVRALEVCKKSGKPMSELHERLTKPLPFTFIKTGLTRDRNELYRMIENRVDVMIQEGLVDEVKRVMDMKPCHTALQAIGYKEIVRHFNGEIGLDEAIMVVKRASKRYAKRQYTWFRKEQDVNWIDSTGITDEVVMSELIIKRISDAL